MADSARTFSALARALPERAHPQWKWLQCRYASVMSFKLARTFLRDAFPGGATLACSSAKATVRATGNRLEAEARQATLDTAAEVRSHSGATGPARAALQIDAGYIRSIPRGDGTRWFATVASKLVVRGMPSTPAHAYVTVGYDPTQGMRQQAFLRSIGIRSCCPADGPERQRRGHRLRVSDSVWGRTRPRLVSHRNAVRAPPDGGPRIARR
jgi:hypothetical protein